MMLSPTLQMDALLPHRGNSGVFDPVFKLASSADCSSSPGSSAAECWGDASHLHDAVLSRKLAAEIRGLENDIESGQHMHSGIESNFDNVQDRRSGQDLWSAELAAALAPFAEDTASLGRLGRHDDFDKDYSNLAYRSANPRFKTEVCRNFKEKGTCLYGDLCQFAHGKHELRSDVVRHNKYKTKLCQKYWIAGYCAYGPRCNFIHQEIDKDEAMRILASGSMDARGFVVSAGPKAFVSGHVDWSRRFLPPGGPCRGGGGSYAGSAGSSDSEPRADPDLGLLGTLASRQAFFPSKPAAPLDLADVANLLPATFGFADLEDEPRLDRRPREGQRGDFGCLTELAESLRVGEQ